MRITRIELEGAHGHVAIERKRTVGSIRIDSVLRNRQAGLQAWRVWQLPPTVRDHVLFKVAAEVQQRTDGSVGTNSMIREYLRELQRFQD